MYVCGRSWEKVESFPLNFETMTYFSSEYECKLDEKGRVVLPSRFKAALPESSENRIVVTRGFEPCLTIYPFEEWMKIFQLVAGLNEFNREDRLFQRNFLRGNTEIELDKAGRCNIPKSMQRYAKLDRDVIMVGLGNRIEVWNPEVYDEYLINDQEEFSMLAQKYFGSISELAQALPDKQAMPMQVKDDRESVGSGGKKAGSEEANPQKGGEVGKSVNSSSDDSEEIK